MGWWEIEATKTTPSGENFRLVSGDSPADILGDAVQNVLAFAGKLDNEEEWYEKPVAGVTQADMDGLFLRREFPQSLYTTEEAKAKILETVDKAWAEIKKEYQDEFERDPEPEEVQSAHNFVLGGRFLFSVDDSQVVS